MKKLILACGAVAVFATAPVFAQVPNHKAVVEQVFRAADWDLREKSENGCLTEEVAFRLHQADPNWGHLRKFPGQNQWNGHAVDAVLHKSGWAVDIIGKSATPEAKPAWTVDKPSSGKPRYPDAAKYFMVPKAGCKLDAPTDPGVPPPPPPPPPQPVLDIAELQRLIVAEVVGRQERALKQQDEFKLAVEALADEIVKLQEQADKIAAQKLPCFTADSRVLGTIRLCPDEK